VIGRAPRGMMRVKARARTAGHLYDPRFVEAADRAQIVAWLETLHPLWEQRYSAHHPPPSGQENRSLLRPVYWLGNWQFACLDYYRPPKGIWNRCVQAEPFPPVLARLVAEVERRVHARFAGDEIPQGWHLNTCLVNFYGSRVQGQKRTDTARVGEHKDFEPGPVASISLGERALFQFVSSKRPGERDAVELLQWLDDGSLQIFGGARFKEQLFHRVQRVDTKGGFRFAQQIDGFETRRVNFTFRFVPDAHVVPYARLPADDAEDVRAYMAELARFTPFFATELAARR
jgi:alkylated DNA repair protein (DNA oxidative demethylase)